MPEDLKVSQIGSSPLPPPFRGLHSPGVRKHCQIIFACYFRKSSIPTGRILDRPNPIGQITNRPTPSGRTADRLTLSDDFQMDIILLDKFQIDLILSDTFQADTSRFLRLVKDVNRIVKIIFFVLYHFGIMLGFSEVFFVQRELHDLKCMKIKCTKG